MTQIKQEPKKEQSEIQPKKEEQEEQEEQEQTEEEMEYEIEQIDLMFPNAQFTVAISIKELDDIITDKNYIIIKQAYNCYCYSDCKRNTEYFYIQGKNITNKYVIERLIECGLDLDCNHMFVEGFCQTIGSDCQFEICVGS